MIQLKKASPKYFTSMEAWTLYNYVDRYKITESDLNKKYPTIIDEDGYIYIEDIDSENFITSDNQTFITSEGLRLVTQKGDL